MSVFYNDVALHESPREVKSRSLGTPTLSMVGVEGGGQLATPLAVDNWEHKAPSRRQLLLTEVLGHVNHVFNQISSSIYKPLFKIFTFAMIFLDLDDVVDLEILRWIEIRYHPW